MELPGHQLFKIGDMILSKLKQIDWQKELRLYFQYGLSLGIPNVAMFLTNLENDDLPDALIIGSNKRAGGMR